MLTTTKLLAAIDAFVDKHRKDEQRRHLGASSIGDSCERRIWFRWRWFAKENFDARLKRLFWRGHRTEGYVFEMLRGAGLTIDSAGEDGELKEALRVSFCDGHFGGTPDGIIRDGLPDLPPKTPALLEIKTHNANQFAQLEKKGVARMFPKYMAQMNIYMKGHNLKWALYVGVCKNDDSIYLELIPANEALFKFYIERAKKIIGATHPPEGVAEEPSYYECKWCSFHSICYDNKPPLRNCRTCQFARPRPFGEWGCTLNRREITHQQGCPAYQLNPSFKCQSHRPHHRPSAVPPPPPPAIRRTVKLPPGKGSSSLLSPVIHALLHPRK